MSRGRNPSTGVERQASFPPYATRDTFKDVLIFEERLKQNAERLTRQRKRYELFLILLVLIILFLSYSVFILPSIYSLVHIAHVASLLISLVTLILFFATGMYGEKIAYANKFVPQANRALRPFNIYLNTKKQAIWAPIIEPFMNPSSSALYKNPSMERRLGEEGEGERERRASVSSVGSASSGGARSIRTRSPVPSSPEPAQSSLPPPISLSPPALPSPSPPPQPTIDPNAPVTRTLPLPPSPTNSPRKPLNPLPPATNPRGELIFSSRVTSSFREGYERYRAEWERRREVKPSSSWFGWFSSKQTTSASASGCKDKESAESGKGGGERKGGSRTSSNGRNEDNSRTSSSERKEHKPRARVYKSLSNTTSGPMIAPSTSVAAAKRSS